MSYAFSMTVDAGGAGPFKLEGFEEGYTYNVAPMFYRAFGEGSQGVKELIGLTGREAAPVLDAAIRYMRKHGGSLQELNPSNGFGSYAGALRLLVQLRAWCSAAPLATFCIE